VDGAARHRADRLGGRCRGRAGDRRLLHRLLPPRQHALVVHGRRGAPRRRRLQVRHRPRDRFAAGDDPAVDDDSDGGAASSASAAAGRRSPAGRRTSRARRRKPLNTSANLGKAYVNGAWISGAITAADITFKANAQVQKATGTLGGADITYGAFQISGSLEKFFIDATLNALMMAGTPTNLVFVKRDALTGATYVYDIRAAVLMDGQPPVSDSTNPIKEPYKWTAQADAVLGIFCHIQKIEATPAVGT
jgi:hypothetical protein